MSIYVRVSEQYKCVNMCLYNNSTMIITVVNNDKSVSVGNTMYILNDA